MGQIPDRYQAAVGRSKDDLDTPALCVDLDRLESNIQTMQAAVARAGLATRPHAKTHRSADIARMQLAAGAIGISVAKVGEAEALMAEGLDRICMTTANPTPAKVRRAMALSRRSAAFIHATDTEENARLLSEAARDAGVTAAVVVDVAVGMRSGIPAGEGALALARLVDQLPNLSLKGLLSYDGLTQHVVGFAARRAQALKNIEASLATSEAMRKAGLNTEIFSGGGTGTYDIYPEVPGFTDLQVGSYIFLDMQYLGIGSRDGNPVFTDFSPSLTVVATVINNRFPGRITTDAGAKALTLNQPRAGVVGEPGADYDASADEFGIVVFPEAPRRAYRIGDRLEVVVPHCDPVVNLYDVMFGVRGGQVERIMPVTARGRSQ